MDVEAIEPIRIYVEDPAEIPTQGYYFAIFVKNGIEYKFHFMFDGKLHKVAPGPALVDFKGRCEFYQHGVRTRSSGPAVLHGIGLREYWQDGVRHRINGPAIMLDRANPHNVWVRDSLVCVPLFTEGFMSVPDESTLKKKFGKGRLFDGDEYWLEGKRLTREEFLVRTSSEDVSRNLHRKEEIEVLADEMSEEVGDIVES